MAEPENSVLVTLAEIRALELERIREEEERELRQREAEERAREEEVERERRARALEEERRRELAEARERAEAEARAKWERAEAEARAKRERAEAEARASLERARREADDRAAQSLKPRFPVVTFAVGVVLIVGAVLATRLLQPQLRDAGVLAPDTAAAARLEVQRWSREQEHSAELARMETRIRELQEQLDAARKQVALTRAGRDAESGRHHHHRHERSRPAEAVEAPAKTPEPPMDTAVEDPLAGLNLD
jgi:hypothetical protein